MTQEDYVKIEQKVKLAEWITRAVMVFHVITLISMDGGSYQFFSSLRSL